MTSCEVDVDERTKEGKYKNKLSLLNSQIEFVTGKYIN